MGDQKMETFDKNVFFFMIATSCVCPAVISSSIDDSAGTDTGLLQTFGSFTFTSLPPLSGPRIRMAGSKERHVKIASTLEAVRNRRLGAVATEVGQQAWVKNTVLGETAFVESILTSSQTLSSSQTSETPTC